MSVILYRDGERVLVPPQTLDAHLGNGYFLTREESLCEEVSTEEESEEVQEVTAATEVEEPKVELDNDEDELSDDDIRLTAKNLSIPNWHNMGIEKLKAKIEIKQNGDSK